LKHYFKGIANGETNRLETALHPDFKLYYLRKDSVRIMSSKDYISRIKHGVKSNRVGKVISIEHEGNAASAKNEVDMRGRKRTYTDHLLVLKEIGV